MAEIRAIANEALASANAANEAVTALAEGQVAENTDTISRIITRVDALTGVTIEHTATLEEHETELDELAKQIKAIGEVTDITVNETIVAINNKINALEEKEAALAADIVALEDATEAKIGVLEAKDEELAAEIAVKANAADVYTKVEANSTFVKVTELESAIDDRINTLIDGANSEDTITNVTNLIEFVNNNAGTIADLVTTVNNNTATIAANTAAIDANTDNIAANSAAIAVNATDIADNKAAIAENVTAIAANKAAHEKNTADIAALDEKIEATRPKESDEISVSPNGTISIKQMTTDKLVQGENELILDGGFATNN